MGPVHALAPAQPTKQPWSSGQVTEVQLEGAAQVTKQ
jgi:hypothetical protein